MMLSSRLASLLFKSKAVDTVLDLLSFNLQFWRYDDIVAISWLRAWLRACYLKYKRGPVIQRISTLALNDHVILWSTKTTFLT